MKNQYLFAIPVILVSLFFFYYLYTEKKSIQSHNLYMKKYENYQEEERDKNKDREFILVVD